MVTLGGSINDISAANEDLGAMSSLEAQASSLVSQM